MNLLKEVEIHSTITWFSMDLYISAERSVYKGQGHIGNHGWVVNSGHSMDLRKYEYS